MVDDKLTFHTARPMSVPLSGGTSSVPSMVAGVVLRLGEVPGWGFEDPRGSDRYRWLAGGDELSIS